MTKKKINNGFTLVETMVVVSVFMVVMSLALVVFSANVKNHRAALYKQRMISEVGYALAKVEKKIISGDPVAESDVAAHLSSVISIDNFQKNENGNIVTILLETSTKTEEGGSIPFKVQTTAVSR